MMPAIPRLFLADDSEADGMLLRMAFADAEVNIELIQVFDGATAWNALQIAAQTRPFPYDLIMVDLRMPCLSGLELLGKLNTISAIADIPKVILTNSLSPWDLRRSLKYGPTLYLTKPEDYRGMVRLVKRFEPFLNRRDGSHTDTPTESLALTDPSEP